MASSQLFPVTPLEDAFFQVAERFEGDGTCHIAVRLDTCLEDEPLRLALDALQQRHPKLRTRLVQSQDVRRCYELLDAAPPIPLKIVDTDRELPRVMADPTLWHDGVIENQAIPLIRAWVLRNRLQPASILTLTIPHALVGGTAQVGLVADLLSHYSQARQTGSPAVVEPLPLVLDTPARQTVTVRQRLRVGMERIRYLRALRRGFVDLPSDPDADPLPFCHRWSLTSAESMKLIQKCRRESTSIYGALLAASLLGLRDALQQPAVRVACRCPVDVRTQLEGDIGAKDLGVFGVLYQQIYAVGERDSFWDLARTARQDVKAFVDNGGGTLLYQLLNRLLRRAARRRRKRGASPAEAPKRPTLQVSFIGPVEKGPSDEDLGIVDLVLAVVSAHLGLSLMVGGYLADRQLQFGVTGFGLPRDFWAAYLVRMKHHLEHALQDVPGGLQDSVDGVDALA